MTEFIMPHMPSPNASLLFSNILFIIKHMEFIMPPHMDHMFLVYFYHHLMGDSFFRSNILFIIEHMWIYYICPIRQLLINVLYDDTIKIVST